MKDKQKFLDLLQLKKNESGLSTAKFLSNGVSESKFSKFMQDAEYALTDASLAEILDNVDIDLYTVLYNELAQNEPGTHVRIIYQYGEDGILRPLSLGDQSSTFRSKIWKKHEAVLCKTQPYENWTSLYCVSEKTNIMHKEVYRAPSIVFFKEKFPIIGVYSYTTIFDTQRTLLNLNTYENIDVNFEEAHSIYPIDCSFAPRRW